MKLLGIGLANGLTAMAGAFFAQLFGAADVYSGIGVVIIGLASVIVGMAIFPVELSREQRLLVSQVPCSIGLRWHWH